jgi:serine/threonine protein kinase
MNTILEDFAKHSSKIHEDFQYLSKMLPSHITFENTIRGIQFLESIVRYILNQNNERIYPRFVSHLSFQIAQKMILGHKISKNKNDLQGGLSQVYLAMIDKIKFVAKIIPESDCYNREFLALFQNHYHPNIEVLLGRNQSQHILFLEYYDGHPLKFCPEFGMRKIIFKIVQAIAHLHKQGIIHGDIKKENILMSNVGGVHVVDFNLSQSLGENMHGRGTPRNMPPETKDFHENIIPQFDIWTLGYLIYNVYTKDSSYERCTMERVVAYCKDRFKERTSLYLPGFLEGNFIYTEEKEKLFPNLVNKMLSFKPSARPTIQQVLEDPVFADLYQESLNENNDQDNSVVPISSSLNGLYTDAPLPLSAASPFILSEKKTSATKRKISTLDQSDTSFKIPIMQFMHPEYIKRLKLR